MNFGIASCVALLYVRNNFQLRAASENVCPKSSNIDVQPKAQKYFSVQECDATGDAICTNAWLQKKSFELV